ncbi:hypothetical protein ACFXA3_14145 [Streptomyces sp. NPDC059456]|uniref:hypothetical protein n=1 Tax=Streptomyces sp. NPDC059456 TaxID=3346838 RepID=UPI003676BDEE
MHRRRDSTTRSTWASSRLGDVATVESRDFPAGSYLPSGEVAQHLMTRARC